MAGDGQRENRRERARRPEPAELEGERGKREASGRAGGRAGGRAARDAPEIHGQGGLNGRAAPAGRPLGSCYTAGAPAAAQPRRRRAHAARRGPRGHDDARGDRSALGPHSLPAQPGERGATLTGKGPFLPTRDRPALALPASLGGPRTGLRGAPARRSLPARSRPLSRQLRPGRPGPPLWAPRTGLGLALRAGTSPTLSPGPQHRPAHDCLPRRGNFGGETG